MSGGHWLYKEQEAENYHVHKLPVIVETLMIILHKIDYDICGDTTRNETEKEVYDLIKELGEKLFESYS